MAPIPHQHRHRLLTAALLTLTLLATAPAPATADLQPCHFDAALGALVCPGHSGGSGGTNPNPAPNPGFYYTAWQFVGPCGNPLWIDGTVWLHYRRYKIYTNGAIPTNPTEQQDRCIEPVGGARAAWDAVADAVAALTAPVYVADPDGDTTAGLTGLTTRLWYPGPTQVGPIGVTWTEPVSGITSALQGRGWVGTLTWDTGNRDLLVKAHSFHAGASVGGTATDPAARYIYQTTSAGAGHPDGYPVTVRVRWIGEFRIRPPGAAWLPWGPIGNSLTQTASSRYRVDQVQSLLTP